MKLKHKKEVKIKEFKLTIEPIPGSSYYNNLRKRIKKTEWDIIRKKTYEQYGHKCGICGAKGRLNCHETWEYDNKTHVQRLAGFIALCDLCHLVKHPGFAEVESGVAMRDVIEHFMKVNNCEKKDYKKHCEEVATQRKISDHEWVVDFGEYKSYSLVSMDEVEKKQAVSLEKQRESRKLSIQQKNKAWLESSGKYGLPKDIIDSLYEGYFGDISHIDLNTIKIGKQATKEIQTDPSYINLISKKGKSIFFKDPQDYY